MLDARITDKLNYMDRTHRDIWGVKLLLFAGLWVILPMSIGGCDANKIMKDAMEPFFPPSPGEVTREVFNTYDADKRRRGIILLANAKFGGDEPYLRTYRMLIDDEDASVRAACVKALAMHGKVEDVPLLVRRLKDDASFVRWEAALALQRIHNPIAVEPLMLAVSKDEDSDVRMAAATALGQYAEPRVFEILVSALDDQEYAVVQNAHESLQTLTGQNLDPDGAVWLAFKKEHPGDALFKNQQQYLWKPYTKPKGTLDYVKFWKKKPTPQPAPPVGATTQTAEAN